METNRMVMGTTLDAFLVIAGVFAAALWAIALGAYMFLNGIAEPPVWLMLTLWSIPVIVVGAGIMWAIRRNDAVYDVA